MEYIGGRHDRVLAVYDSLIEGNTLNVKAAAEHFGVSTKTIKRDIDDIRGFLAEKEVSGKGGQAELIYDRSGNSYRLVGSEKLTGKEVFAVCKVLLESRPFCKEEFLPIIDKLTDGSSYDNDLSHVRDMVANEKYHYSEPSHGKKIIDAVWELSYAVHKHKQLRIKYERLTEPKSRERIVNPVGILFSDYYFYLAAFIPEKNTKNPTIYRIDRLEEYEILKSGFAVPYASRFEEGEFRKRIQFMYGGELLRLEFNYFGESPEAILDRFPTAEIIEQTDGITKFRAEVFGRGIKPWLLSQADKIELLSPSDLRCEMQELIEKMYNMYK